MTAITIGALALGYGLATGTHALLNTRDPRSSLGWTVLCITIPFLGATFYWFFGVNRIKTKARQWQQRGRFKLDAERGYGDARTKVDDEHPERAETLSALTRISERVTRKPLLRGNKVEPLYNGEQAYPAMLEAIYSAAKSVYLCTYLFETDAPGMAFVDALGDAADRGVDVRVIVDAIGEHYSVGPRVTRLLTRRKGVKVARFLPLTLSLRGLRVNLRNHRKILIVDSKVGFTGGMNIGGRNMVDDPGNKHPTQDLHFRITGPMVYALEETFFEDWLFATGEQPDWIENQDSPVLEPAGEAMCRAISDGPNEDFEALTWILVGALSVARERIQIMTPYFIPSRELLSALNAAVLRGVSVDILLPARNNLPFVAWASQALLDEVLTYGTRVYYQSAPFNHSKLLIVDEFYALIGSANLDPRSLRLNFEFNVEVYDTRLARELSAHFDRCLAGAQPITTEWLMSRGFLVRLRNSVAKVFSPYL